LWLTIAVSRNFFCRDNAVFGDISDSVEREDAVCVSLMMKV
jgi:hypothetical protein